MVSLLLFQLFFLNVGAQVCGGSFGDPVFIEDFGSTAISTLQTAGPLNSANATTTYRYNSVYPPNDGFYTIANFTGPNNQGWAWVTSADHTLDNGGKYGNMLIVNADDKKTGEFYRRQVDGLCPNQVYRFSVWIINILNPGANQIKPNVTLQIQDKNGLILGSISTGDIEEDAKWREYFIDFKSDVNSGDVQVVLINNSLGGMGNDLAIDDITFRPCGPATTIASSAPEIFQTGVCENNQPFTLSAEVNANTFQTVNYIWQVSKDMGVSWINLSSATSNPKITINAGEYKDFYQYRFIVGEASNILSSSCQVISKPVVARVYGYPKKPVLQPISICQNHSSDINLPYNKVLWYKSETGGIGTATTPAINTSILGTTTYWVSRVENGCESERAPIDITVYPFPAAPIVSSSVVEFCQNEKSAPLSAEGLNLLWYNFADGGTGTSNAPIQDTSKSVKVSYWVTQTTNGCESKRSRIDVEVLPAPYTKTLHDVEICDGDTAVLDAGLGPDYSYEWNTVPPVYTQTLTVSKTGTHQVKITGKNGCSATQQVNVVSGISPEITNIYAAKDYIEITAVNGNPPYFYSIDGENWQPENKFINLKPKVYTVYVKSQTNSCTAMSQIGLVNVPNVFTPNGDGINDTFEITNINFFPKAKITVYDRFGKKLFYSENTEQFSWEGKQNGRNLPTETYWYVLDLGNGYQQSGWVLLKNRN